MIITKEWIDVFVPNHGRSSCDDNNLNNSFGGWTGKYSRDNGMKEIKYPRCNRCYLLDHIGEDTDNLEFSIEIHVDLNYKNNSNEVFSFPRR